MVAGEAAFLFFNFLFLCWKIEETGSGLPEAQASFQAFDVLAVASGSLTKKKKKIPVAVKCLENLEGI